MVRPTQSGGVPCTSIGTSSEIGSSNASGSSRLSAMSAPERAFVPVQNARGGGGALKRRGGEDMAGMVSMERGCIPKRARRCEGARVRPLGQPWADGERAHWIQGEHRSREGAVRERARSQDIEGGGRSSG